MHGAFWDCFSLESLDVSTWDTSNVTDMSYMFYGDKSLHSLNLSGWDTSSVTSMELMFMRCASLASLEGISGWDTSSATNMGGMFCGCSSLASLDLSGWDTSKVQLMHCMFLNCSSLSSVGDLSGWDVGNVYYMPALFSGCSSLESLNLSSWNASNADMGNMFEDCSSLRTISLSDSFAFTKGSCYAETILLPTPVGCELTGKWVSSVDGKAYAPEEIPNNVAATYTAQGVVFPNLGQTFPDVDYSQWYADGVTFCARKGLITGYPTGFFGVGDTLTRAQLAAILWRNAEPEAAEAYDGNAANSTGMADVADDQWYTGAANWAVANEIINGADKGDHREFCPNDPVTVEQLATILANYAAEGTDGIHYHAYNVCNSCDFKTDRRDNSDAFTEHVRNTGHGGYHSHKVKCNRTGCTETKFIMVDGKLQVVTGNVPIELSVLDSFVDANAISDWARESVAWAKFKGIINGYEENGVRLLKPQEEIARERVATILMNAFENGTLK